MAAADQEGPVGSFGAVGHLCQRAGMPGADDRDLSRGARRRRHLKLSKSPLLSLSLSATVLD